MAERPIRCRSAGRSARRRRSSDSARWAPRLVEATAWISSTITVSTPASISRAWEVRIRYSDSGVVIRMSGGLAAHAPPLALRGVAGAHPRIRGMPARRRDAAQRRAQVALDVVAERLQRRDVEHARARHRRAAARRPGGRGPTGTRPASCPTRWGPTDQRVVAARDRRPALRLGRRGLGERRLEPLADAGGEGGEGQHRSRIRRRRGRPTPPAPAPAGTPCRSSPPSGGR